MNWPPRWEPDDWVWELVRLDELGLPSSLNFRVPDKLMHALTCFLLPWLLYALWGKYLGRHLCVLIPYVLMMGLWEVVWDGMFRHGMSSPDMVANTIGAVTVWLWLDSYDHVGQSQL